MNWLDVLLALIIFISALFGYIIGFLRKFFGLLGIAAGFIAAVKFFNPVGDFLIARFHTSDSMPAAAILVLCFIIIFCLVYFLFIFAAKYITKLHPAMNILNRFLGIIIGFLQGVLITSILLFNLNYFHYPPQDVRNNSMLYGKLINIAPAFFDTIISYFPGSKSIYEEYKRLSE